MKKVAGSAARLSIESQVLIQAISRKEGTEDQLRTALTRGLDYQFLLQGALRHGIFPSFYLRLLEAGLEGANPEFFHRLRELYRLNARRNLKIVGELLKLLAFLEEHGITAIPFKGPALAALAYGDPVRRYFVDLDILVAPRDARRAKDLLLARGYKLHAPFSPRQERAHLRQSFEFGLTHPHLTMVEIHWRFAEIFLSKAPEPEGAIARRVQISLAGKTAPSLAPDDLLMVLCLHGISHLWFTLGMINDVACLWETQGPWDWPRLWQTASQSGLQRILLLGLALAHELLGTELPQEVLRRIEADPAVPALRREAAAKLFTRAEPGLGFGERVRFQLRARERWRDKLSYLWLSLAYPSRQDWCWLPLPDRVYYLYYALRPLRLLLQRLILPVARRLKPSGEARSPIK